MSSITDRLQLGVIIGSTREGRAGATVARWFLAHARQHRQFSIEVIDLADVPLPSRYPQEPDPDQVNFAARIERADAFVVVTPEYNHSYPASLKHAIDCAYAEWHAKPVGFVSYGGVAQGLRAVEHLRGVFGELHAVTIRDGVSVNLFDGSVDESGWIREGSGADNAAKTMLDRLTWWAYALRDARNTRPYLT